MAVILLFIILLAIMADSVLPAPVPEKFAKYEVVMILYATYNCLRVGGYVNLYPLGIVTF